MKKNSLLLSTNLYTPLPPFKLWVQYCLLMSHTFREPSVEPLATKVEVGSNSISTTGVRCKDFQVLTTVPSKNILQQENVFLSKVCHSRTVHVSLKNGVQFLKRMSQLSLNF